MIHRCFVSRNVELLTRAFVAYVRPLLEYNSTTVWFGPLPLNETSHCLNRFRGVSPSGCQAWETTAMMNVWNYWT